ncbi:MULTISPECIES: hypothetical protein [Vitreoscilla]|uniref:Uncharacterized protein n=1 Tax=Vitreoscilla stercoraria TaxID=61 RepID=A0ABY4ECE0_VITST|nr:MULTISPECIES: hypothetical protein [Vitreoscilla]AUZ05251.1 hypothetical protein ADP71_17240 [Vitreoscilla sp. C1]UOO93412.1 hypothetical protein LVJ81_05120 [Vitreoscilla stercoraria]
MFEFFKDFLLNLVIELFLLYLYWLHKDAYIGYYEDQIRFWVVPVALGFTVLEYLFW